MYCNAAAILAKYIHWCSVCLGDFGFCVNLTSIAELNALYCRHRTEHKQFSFTPLFIQILLVVGSMPNTQGVSAADSTSIFRFYATILTHLFRYFSNYKLCHTRMCVSPNIIILLAKFIVLETCNWELCITKSVDTKSAPDMLYVLGIPQKMGSVWPYKGITTTVPNQTRWKPIY
jgi:hypothetical protein